MKMRSMSRPTLLALVGILSGLSVDMHSQSVGAGRAGQNGGFYSVTGKVVLPDGKPAVGTRIDLTCDFTSMSGSTDMDGVYRITGVPAGNCAVKASIPGLDSVTEYQTIQRDTPQGQAIYIPLFFRGNQVFSHPMFNGVPKQALDKFKTAMEKLDKGDADGALSMLEQAIALHSKFAGAWYQKGSILLKKNENDKAIAAFVKAIEIKPEYLEAKYGYGVAYFQKKSYEVAEAVFRDVLKTRADMAEAHLNLGICLYHLKNMDAAETEFKAAAAAKGGEKFALAHLYLGQIYMQKKRNPDAIAELQKYIELLPKAPNAERIKTVIADLKKQS